ncbi:MAG: hypothetical protein ACJ790_06135 [Myxococcaceae bacterium]
MQAGDARKSLIVHPLPIAALLVLLLNDHWLKHAHPSWLTGKLSDFAGLLLAPIVVCEIALMLMRRQQRAGASAGGPRANDSRHADASPVSDRQRTSIRIIAAVTILFAIVFTLIKLVPACSELYVRFSGLLLSPFGAHAASVSDPTDLIALAVLPPVFLWASRRAASSEP